MGIMRKLALETLIGLNIFLPQISSSEEIAKKSENIDYVIILDIDPSRESEVIKAKNKLSEKNIKTDIISYKCKSNNAYFLKISSSTPFKKFNQIIENKIKEDTQYKGHLREKREADEYYSKENQEKRANIGKESADRWNRIIEVKKVFLEYLDSILKEDAEKSFSFYADKVYHVKTKNYLDYKENREKFIFQIKKNFYEIDYKKFSPENLIDIIMIESCAGIRGDDPETCVNFEDDDMVIYAVPTHKNFPIETFSMKFRKIEGKYKIISVY
ncbi:MAG: hypothetical protein KKE23_03635 [Nanoarchaeota archaeon]|nr:hypothetical protein [Nanoarchaeota archaeon]